MRALHCFSAPPLGILSRGLLGDHYCAVLAAFPVLYLPPRPALPRCLRHHFPALVLRLNEYVVPDLRRVAGAAPGHGF